MRKFRQLIDTVRAKGFDWYFVDTSERVGTPEEIEDFYRLVERCHVFVFEDAHGEGGDEFVRIAQATPEDGHLPDIESAPFEVFSIEAIGPLLAKAASNILRGEHATEFQLAHTEIECILSYETEPGRFWFYIMFVRETGHRFVAHTEVTGSSIVEIYLRRMRKERLGLDAVKERVRLGSGKSKREHVIRRVIRVAPHASYASVRSLAGRTIDWTHRWLVRGHWRKHKGIGKNRAGDYCVEGFTWVTEHERGPEDAPLIEKTRIVRTEEVA